MTRIDAFYISANEPRDLAKTGREYTSTFACGVVATDIEDAIRAFKAVHHRATMFSISHRGCIEIITSDAAKAAEGRP